MYKTVCSHPKPPSTQVAVSISEWYLKKCKCVAWFMSTRSLVLSGALCAYHWIVFKWYFIKEVVLCYELILSNSFCIFEWYLLFMVVMKIVGTKVILGLWALLLCAVWPFWNKWSTNYGEWVIPLLCILKGVKHRHFTHWRLVITFLTL